MSPTDQRAGTRILWDCVCLLCGRHRLVAAQLFAAGYVRSCEDCANARKGPRKHGMSTSPEYGAWKNAADGWPDFQEFLWTMGPKPIDCELGRLDTTKSHGQGNSAWAPVFPHLGKYRGRLDVQLVFCKDGQTYYSCLCDCGRLVARKTDSGFTEQSHCGHISHSITHGHTSGKASRTYKSWMKMLARCFNPNSDHYKWYGRKGVKVCRRWHKFENFLTDMGERPEGMTLGRFLDLGDYEPGNVRWQTKTQQVAEQMKKRALLASATRKPPVSVGLELEIEQVTA
jgi:hypothetical protein